jgi:hypothetical protein
MEVILNPGIKSASATSDKTRRTRCIQRICKTRNTDMEKLKMLWIFLTLRRTEEIWIPGNNVMYMNLTRED